MLPTERRTTVKIERVTQTRTDLGGTSRTPQDRGTCKAKLVLDRLALANMGGQEEVTGAAVLYPDPNADIQVNDVLTLVDSAEWLPAGTRFLVTAVGRPERMHCKVLVAPYKG